MSVNFQCQRYIGQWSEKNTAGKTCKYNTVLITSREVMHRLGGGGHRSIVELPRAPLYMNPP